MRNAPGLKRKMSMYLIANWKMYISYKESLQLLKQYQTLEYDGQKISLVVCPSYESLSLFEQHRPNFLWAAQNCSAQEAGAYTGQVSIQSLKELGCSYCLIGHYECRMYLQETNQDIYTKYQHLCARTIKPIFCIGNEQGSSLQDDAQSLYEQLVLVKNHKNLMVAYEPYWAIGAHSIPSFDYLQGIITYLKTILDPSTTFLYGGSITSTTLVDVRLRTLFDGFLIGKASTDFQAFKKIVLSVL